MKNIIYSILGLSLFALISCQNDDVPEPTTQQKILGAWKLQKAVDEYYQPVNTLIETDEYLGVAGDSVVFKSDNMVYSYSPVEGNDETTYQILNDTTIRIEDELYKIRKLSATELNLFQEHLEPAVDERYIQRLYFVR